MSITEETGHVAPGWTADASTFGARLALIRQKMGWGNIAKAAKECGLPTDSWRNWEVDGREPHRMVTIAMTIAGRVGCDLDWLVYGPQRGGVRTTHEWGPDARVVRVVGMSRDRPIDPPTPGTAPTRSVRQTRPIGVPARRPLTPVAM